jgi:hypothetical protein
VEDLVCEEHAAIELEGQDKDAALPNVLPELIQEQQVQADPVPGGAAFQQALGRVPRRFCFHPCSKTVRAIRSSDGLFRCSAALFAKRMSAIPSYEFSRKPNLCNSED